VITTDTSMADSETSQLLPNYSATAEQPAKMKPTEGRGKMRFEMRQKMKKNNFESRSNRSIFGSVFSASPQLQQTLIKGGRSTNSLPIDVSKSPKPVTHSQLYTTLNPKSSAPSALLFQNIITVVIVLDLLIYILSTEPTLSHLSFFYAAEAFSSTIFAIEYITRLIVCTEKRCYGKHGPIRGRWKFICSWHAVLDALATFPFFIELLSGIPLPTTTYLRIFRVLRITRTNASCKAVDAVYRYE